MELARRKFHVPGFDPGEVEHVVQHAEQCCAGVEDGAAEVCLALRQFGVAQ